jgi:protein-tyrosine phosphatase
VPSRDVPLQALFNVRDLGGLPAAEGRTVRTGLLYRGAGLHRLAAADAAAVAALGWRTVFDLRTPGELRRTDSFPIDHVHVERCHAPMLQRAWLDDGRRGSAAELLADRYVAMLETGAPAVGLVVRRLASADALPAAFFCAAGKDRTGVLAAVLLGLLGVPDEEIAADYARSEANVRLLTAWLDVNEPDTGAWIHALDPALLEAPAAALLMLLAQLRERHDSVEAYVRRCGAGARDVARLRDALLQPAAVAPLPGSR